LGASLIREIKRRRPDAEFIGIAGPQMQSAGCETLYEMERLSVMGLFESFGRYPELIPLRSRLAQRLVDEPPAVVIGVDAPDFNLALERKVRERGIPTVHFVSPSVWAWRSYRIRKIRRSVQLMLTLFPFEAEFYESHNVPVEFVGHPLADEIEEEPDKARARLALGVPLDGDVVALLPGSRVSEVRFLADPLIRTAHWLSRRRPGVKFIVPLVGRSTREQFETALTAYSCDLDIRIFEERSRECMIAADAVILASGTASLEAMLLKKPMVITYRALALTYWLMERLVGVNVGFAGLPNLLAGRLVVPELMQRYAAPEWLGPPILRALENPDAFRTTREEFGRLHQQLKKNAASRAAVAVLRVAGQQALV